MPFKTTLYPSYDAMSESCAAVMLETVRKKKDAVLVLATGGSPLSAYRLFVKRVQEEKPDLSEVTFVKLDEWRFLPPENEATCEYFLQKEILQPLNILPERYISFDGEAADGKAECLRIEHALQALPQIDLCVLGIGKNGHVGLNEPDEALDFGAHTVTLQEKTKTHDMLRHAGVQSVTEGITLGLGNLMQAKTLLVLGTGADKKDAYAYMESGKISCAAPVSLLSLHQNVFFYKNTESYSV